MKQFTFASRNRGYCNGNDVALQERRYENPTIGIVVVQVRGVRAVSRDVLQRTAALVTIGAADMFGLPVSTTHVLSSGVAGAMAASGSGLRWRRSATC